MKEIGKTIGDGFDHASEAVGNALSSIIDPLGVKDPKDKKNFGGLIVLIGILAVVGLGFFVVITRK